MLWKRRRKLRVEKFPEITTPADAILPESSLGFIDSFRRDARQWRASMRRIKTLPIQAVSRLMHDRANCDERIIFLVPTREPHVMRPQLRGERVWCRVDSSRFRIEPQFQCKS